MPFTSTRDTSNVPQPGLYTAGQTQTAVPQAGTLNTDSNNGSQVYAPAAVNIADRSNTQLFAAVDAAGRLSTQPLGAGTTPTPVQKAVLASTGSVASLAVPFISNNTKGNSIVVVLAVGNNTAPTIADTTGNTYTQAVIQARSTTFETAIFYATNIAAGANTVTITNGGSAASMAAEIYEVSGLITQVPAVVDQTSSGNNAGSGTATTSLLTPNDPNEIAFVGVALGTAAQTITPAAGWTNDSGQQNPTTPAGFFSFASMSQNLTTLAPVTPKATFTSEPWAMVAASFRPTVMGFHAVVTEAGWNYTNITTGTTTLIKTGAGVLHCVNINKLVASATIEIDDAVTQTNSMGIITLPGTITSSSPINLFYDVTFNTGLSVTTSGATDVTIAWR